MSPWSRPPVRAWASPPPAADDDNEGPITGSELDRASAAALEETGEGHVTETEVGDEESFYEVEVTLDDGSQVDVQLVLSRLPRWTSAPTTRTDKVVDQRGMRRRL